MQKENIKIRKQEEIINICKAVFDSLTVIPEEYAEGVLSNILDDEPLPEENKRTYTSYKGKFLYKVAENLEMLEK